MTIALYTWDTPNGRKITAGLEEFGLPYSIHPVNIGAGDQHKPEFLAISPNNKIPAIVDPDGPESKPISVFESGAILFYLAEKTGKFLPASGEARVRVMEWLMFQMGGFGPMPGQVHHFIELQDPAHRDYGLARYDKETRRLYDVMNKRLGVVEFFGGDLSIADFAMLGWAWRHPRHKVDLAEYPNVKRWYDTMMARPATKRGFEVDVKTPRP